MTKTNDQAPHLTLIKGGKKDRDEWPRHFVSAYVTDTRLMGSMGLYAHWHAAWEDEEDDFHQFFYVETEEAGLETYFSVWTQDADEVERLEKENIGGLGGQKVPLEAEEFKQILRYYADFNEAHDLPLPDKTEEYIELIETAPDASPADNRRLLALQCVPVTSHYQLINYFLMRCYGRDFDAAALLADPLLTREEDGRTVIDPLYPEAGIATMAKNDITLQSEWTESSAFYDDYDQAMSRASRRYLCNSLIEHDDIYEVAVSEITVAADAVAGYKLLSHMEITPAEAALILSRPEFVDVYQVLPDEDDEEFEVFSLDFDSMTDVYEYGKLFFSFYDNNAHVDRAEYRLSGDVRNVYYLTDIGQLLVMSYDARTIRQVEEELARSFMAPKILLTDRYEFKEPVLYEFIQSGFIDFNEFIETVRED